MSLSAQAKVLRALQENKITRVGGEKEIEVNVRVVAATNKDLLREIDEGNFRMDLYHRLSVIVIHVPALSERKEDIPILTKHFCEEICKEYSIPVKTFTPEAMAALQGLPWTGNIRELRNMVERLIILSDKAITDQDVTTFANPALVAPTAVAPAAPAPQETAASDGKGLDYDRFESFQDFKDFAEKEYIQYKLEKNAW